MYIIEMINGGVYEVAPGKLAEECEVIARSLVDNDKPYCNLKSLTFVNRHGIGLIFSRSAISQLENRIEAYQCELLSIANAGHDNYTDGHYRGMTC